MIFPSNGRIALLIVVKELWFTFAYKWHRMPSLCVARVSPPFLNQDIDSSCDEWQCGEPSRPADGMKNMLLAASASMSVYVAAPIVTAAGFVDDSSKQSTNLVVPTASDRFTYLGPKSDEPLKICRIINGMWQVSGAHGYTPVTSETVEKMSYCASEGFTTFDLADIYGPAEDYVGAFSKGRLSNSNSRECQFLTKWVPRPEQITRKMATDAIDRSLMRMKSERLDLLQFHWWDYDNPYYYEAVDHLMHLQQDGKISHLGLTNFDSDHMVDLIEQGAPIVSNQISFSVLDTRPLQQMVPACLQHDVKLLCYGTLLGGFLSDYWLGKPDPSVGGSSGNNGKSSSSSGAMALNNVSLRKYLPWIHEWGGWRLFQELLTVLNEVGTKHSVSVSNVAVRWVLDQPAVGGAIVGIRFGLSEHLRDNERVFNLRLDDSDRAAIAAVQAKGRDLMNVFGDCGGEYRRPSSRRLQKKKDTVAKRMSNFGKNNVDTGSA